MAGSFSGLHQHKISETGRISVPSKFREILKVKYGSDELALLWMGDHLRLYPTAEWDREEARLDEMDSEDENFQKFLRRLYARKSELSIDKNGRIMITSDIREKNGIKGECYVNGFKNRFEIWPADVWEQDVSEEEEAELFKKYAFKIK